MSPAPLLDPPAVRLARIARTALRLAAERAAEDRWDAIERTPTGHLRWLRADGTRP